MYKCIWCPGYTSSYLLTQVLGEFSNPHCRCHTFIPQAEQVPHRSYVQLADHLHCSQLEPFFLFKHCSPKLDTAPSEVWWDYFVCPECCIPAYTSQGGIGSLEKRKCCLILSVGSEITPVLSSVKLLQSPTFYSHNLSFLLLSLGKLLANNFFFPPNNFPYFSG